MFIVLTTNMVALSRGCKPRILFSRRHFKIDKSRDQNIAIVTKTIFDFSSLFFFNCQSLFAVSETSAWGDGGGYLSLLASRIGQFVVCPRLLVNAILLYLFFHPFLTIIY